MFLIFFFKYHCLSSQCVGSDQTEKRFCRSTFFEFLKGEEWNLIDYIPLIVLNPIKLMHMFGIAVMCMCRVQENRNFVNEIKFEFFFSSLSVFFSFQILPLSVLLPFHSFKISVGFAGCGFRLNNNNKSNRRLICTQTPLLYPFNCTKFHVYRFKRIKFKSSFKKPQSITASAAVPICVTKLSATPTKTVVQNRFKQQNEMTTNCACCTMDNAH